VGVIKILLIEDDRLVSGVIRDTLAAEGWDISLREDGESALAEIEGAALYDLNPCLSRIAKLKRLRNSFFRLH